MAEKSRNNHEVAVIIPYYHSNLKVTEKISLAQCVKVLASYPIFLIVPDDMQKSDYPSLSGVRFQSVPKEWMASITAYNQMMLMQEFYELFEKYTYILIYQLDAFVFSDQLSEMCQYGYDYIGAPWLSGYFNYSSAKRCIWRVGNGGFSLRKVKSIINLLKKGMQNNYKVNEDFFFAISNGIGFKTAPIDVALKFSFETEVKRCFRLNSEKLPFGCHAWDRYDYNFWKPFIAECGYDVESVMPDDGKEDEKLCGKYAEQRETAFFWEQIFSHSWLKRELFALFSKKVDSYIIFGAGRYGEALGRIFKDVGFPIKCFIDNNRKLIGKTKLGYEIKDVNAVTFSKYDAVIIAIRDKEEKAEEQLNAYGCVRGVDYILLNDLKVIVNMLKM